MQRLCLPLKGRQRVTAGYKAKEYLSLGIGNHYGSDYTNAEAGSKAELIASGSGQIVAAGHDNTAGNVIVAVYDDVLNHRTGEVTSLAAKYFHLSEIAVKPGDKISRGDILGRIGDTGVAVTGVHLHVEFDRDTAYPRHSPSVRGSNILKGGIDTTVNPSDIFHLAVNEPYGQHIYANPGAWISPADTELPALPDGEYAAEPEKPEPGTPVLQLPRPSGDTLVIDAETLAALGIKRIEIILKE